MCEYPRLITGQDALDGFTCGVPLVDNWFHKRAGSARAQGTAAVYVSVCEGQVAGFYTLSAQSIARSEISGWLARNTPMQIPVILLGMFGVDVRYQKQGLGHDLLLDAVRRARMVAEHIGARALVVDPIDERARSFYAHFGFRLIPGSTRMYARLV